jgi:hypothetical protein
MIFSRAKHFPPIDPTYAPLEDDERRDDVPSGNAIVGMFFAVVLSAPIWIIIGVIVLFGFGII